MRSTWRVRLSSAVRELSPAYFAVVMASGSISLGLHLHDRVWLSRALLAVCAVAFVVLLLMNAWRVIAYAEEVAADIADPARVFGFFTLVAGINVLAARITVSGATRWALALLICAAVIWLVVGYAIPGATMLGHADPIADADGSWFVWAVSAQSIAVVAASLEPSITAVRHGLALTAVVAWSVGCFLYAGACVFVALRHLLYRSTARDFTPTYWVTMGAASITVLAGARIVEMERAAVTDVTRELVAGVAVLFWAFATWLIPLLTFLLLWRHYLRKVPLRYEASQWSMVFPLGMYAVASMYIGTADRLPWVRAIGHAELWVAFAVWLLTFAAMLRHVYRRIVVGSPAP